MSAGKLLYWMITLFSIRDVSEKSVAFPSQLLELKTRLGHESLLTTMSYERDTWTWTVKVDVCVCGHWERPRCVFWCRFPRVLSQRDVPCDLLSSGRGDYHQTCTLRPHVARTLLWCPVLGRRLLRWRHWSSGRCLFRAAVLWTGCQHVEGRQLSTSFCILLKRLVHVRQRYELRHLTHFTD